MYDVNSEVETLEFLLEEIGDNLPYSTGIIADLEKIKYYYDAVYCSWNNEIFENKDVADEFFKNVDGAINAARNGDLIYEDSPIAWNKDYSVKDGIQFKNKESLREFEESVNNLLEWCDEVSDRKIYIKEIPFFEVLEETRLMMTESNVRELEEELKIKAEEKKEIKKQKISKI